MVEFEKAKWPRQVVGAVTLGLFVIVMSSGWPLLVVFGFPLVDAVFPFWGSAGLLGFVPFILWGLFSVTGVLFGAWGVLAVCVGTAVNIGLISGSEIAAFQLASALLVALIPAWTFRHFKGDPRIRTSRDMTLFLLFVVILANIASTLIAHVPLYMYGFIRNLETVRYTIQDWFFKTSISTLVFGFPMLLSISRIVIEARAYCEGWFS